ncbi:unnamed protein product [Schistosoma rodhaini]|uniref:Putative amidase n=1 Tax=Schistosoma mansoni TaxID=6183 RepID=A0A3Q0KBP6_SCHMA|nr:putative amidase [Schistosoma mansoni]CAH8512049.1 unnamed protein product [Schistosoma rodhaini]|eukprot:XP_018650237.1 putative amidase [Schistosoma mansoni]
MVSPVEMSNSAVDSVLKVWKEYFVLLVRHPVRHILVACSLGLVSWKIITSIRTYQNQKLLKSKQMRVTDNMEKMREALTKLTQPSVPMTICSENLSYLCEQIKKKRMTPVDVLHAFQFRALQLQDNNNSGIALFILEAEECAANLMKFPMNIDKDSELYGIPISIKEGIAIRGYDATMGIIKRCNQPIDEDCVLIKVLKSVGAIPFVTTVTTQLCRTLDGFHVIYNDAENPFNKSRLPGGSSSGEAVLLAQCGSPVGIGTDIAGSIRIPCAFCNLAGLKPTSGRLSLLGIVSTAKKSVLYISPCLGPMARKVDDLACVMRALLCPTMFDLDPYVIPMSFDQVSYEGKNRSQLVIGYYSNFDDPNLIQVLDVNQRVVEKAAKALESAGHRLVKFTVPHPYKAFILGLHALFADGGQELRSHLQGEPLSPHIKLINTITVIPDILKPIVEFISKHFIGKPVCPLGAFQKLASGQAAVNLISEIKAYRYEFAKAWNEAGPLDALICPVFPYPAPPKDAPQIYISPSIIYTFLYNILDYPAGAVPAGFVTEDDVRNSLIKSESLYSSGDFYMSKVYKLLDGGENLPLSIQVVGKPYHEETVLRVMREIESCFSLQTES